MLVWLACGHMLGRDDYLLAMSPTCRDAVEEIIYEEIPRIDTISFHMMKLAPEFGRVFPSFVWVAYHPVLLRLVNGMALPWSFHATRAGAEATGGVVRYAATASPFVNKEKVGLFEVD